jgi:hypothetical protein
MKDNITGITTIYTLGLIIAAIAAAYKEWENAAIVLASAAYMVNFIGRIGARIEKEVSCGNRNFHKIDPQALKDTCTHS